MAFIEFANEQVAERHLKTLKGKKLGGKALFIDFVGAKRKNAAATDKKPTKGEPQGIQIIDQSYKSHSAPVPHPTIHHLEQKFYFWSELCNVGQVHCEIGLLV